MTERYALVTPAKTYALTGEEAELAMAAVNTSRTLGRLPEGVEPKDRFLAGLVRRGMGVEKVAKVLGLSVESVNGAVRRVENGRYG